MKLEDYGYVHSEWQGKIEEITITLLDGFGIALGGNDGTMNLIKAHLTVEGLLDLESLRGTILSPAEFLKTKDGTVVPGLLYHGFLDFKKGIDVVDKTIIDAGLFFDLGILATTLHFHTIGMKSITEVRNSGVTELRKRHEKHLLNRHEGIVFRATAEYDPRIGKRTIGISVPIAEALLKVIQSEVGDLAPKTIEELSGMQALVKRFPIASSTSIYAVHLQVVRDNRLSLRFNDYTLKIKMGGDCDGDTPEGFFPQGYLGSEQMQADLGSMKILPPLPDPDHFLTPSFTLSDVCAPKLGWPDSIQTATGLMAKGLQGIICNFFERLGLTATILMFEGTPVVRYGEHFKMCTRDIVGIIKDAGQGAMTEVVLDYRKFKDDNDPGRFASQLWSVIDVALGLDHKLPETVKEIDKDGATVGVDLINEILVSAKHSLALFNDRYPIQGSLIGSLTFKDSNTGKKVDKLGILNRLAEEIAESGIRNYLDAATGHRLESPGISDAGIPKVKNLIRERLIGSGIPITPWGAKENPWSYIARRAVWSGGLDCVILSGNRLTVGPGVITLDPISFTATSPHKDGSSLGFISIELPGEVHRRARLILRSDNATFGRSDQLLGVSLVTILDLLGERLAVLAYEGNRDLENPEKDFNIKAFNDKISDEILSLITEYSRLPGQTEKGDRVQKEINLDSYEAQIVLPQGNTPQQGMELSRQLLTFIGENEFSNPLDSGICHCFDVGMTSKNKPGTVCSMLPPTVKRLVPGKGPIDFDPTHPLLRYVVNGWIDTDRQLRESRTVRFACPLTSVQELWFTNGYENVNPSMANLTKRRRDAIWVGISGASASWMFSDKSLNCDLGRLTPHGMSIYQRQSRPDVRGPISREVLESIISETLGEGHTVEDFAEAGWIIKLVPRRLGRYNKKVVYEEMYTITGPSSGTPTWHKIYMSGHKFVAVPTESDYSVCINGELYPVAGFVPIESLIQKKMQGSMAAALSVLLGKDFFGNLAEGVVNPNRRLGDASDAYKDIVADCATRLKEHELDPSGLLPIVRSDGTSVGLGFAGVYPTYVLREDDKISTSVSANSCPRSVLVARQLGEHIRLSKRVSNEILRISQFISNKLPENLEDITQENEFSSSDDSLDVFEDTFEFNYSE